MTQITTKTVHLLKKRAMELSAIGDAVYEFDRDCSNDLAGLAAKTMAVALRMEKKIEAYAKAAMSSG
jgi:hypothetical protein